MAYHRGPRHKEKPVHSKMDGNSKMDGAGGANEKFEDPNLDASSKDDDGCTKGTGDT